MAVISSKPWNGAHPPRRILAIRLQAMGDVVITLPYLQHLRRSLPADTVLDFLTREEVMEIPQSVELFDHVYAIGGGRNFKKQLLLTLLMLPRLMRRRYDIVIDLQNNLLSRIVRKCLMPASWTAFDRFSPASAGERNRRTIEALGLGPAAALSGFTLRSEAGAERLLHSKGWRSGSTLVVLNPAGAFENRAWPVGHYIEFAALWMQRDPSVLFLVMGIDKISGKAAQLELALGHRLINLVNQTTPAAAFAILQRASFVLSEDSGLMHMAWVSGIPTLALFGSTRSDWSRPLGPHTAFFDSSDMACGNCMRESCLHQGEERNSCMTRLRAELVFERAMHLMDHASATL